MQICPDRKIMRRKSTDSLGSLTPLICYTSMATPPVNLTWWWKNFYHKSRNVDVLCVCFFIWRYPRTRRGWRRLWAGLSMVVGVSSSSWGGWAYFPAYTGSSQAADELWSPDTGLSSSQSSPSWWHHHLAMASGGGANTSISRYKRDA